jgi:outer membrane protein TolC
MRFRILGTFSAVACMLAPVRAEELPNALTWRDCVALAARSNPSLLASLSATEASRAAYKGSYNAVLPSVSFSHSYSDSSRASSETERWAADGTARLDLINTAAWASIQSASAGLRQARANLRLTSAQSLLDLYRTFNNLLYAQEAIQVNTTIRDTWKTNAAMVNLRYQSGRESRGNTLNTQAQSLQADAALEQSHRDLRVAQQALSQVIGQETFSVLTVTGTWSAAPVPMPRPDMDGLLTQTPQVQVQQAALEQTEAAIKTARSALWPTLSAGYTRGLRGATEFPQNPYWTFTGTLNYPLFGGGLTSTYYASKAAEAAHERARQDLRAARLETRGTLESAWAAFAQAHDQIIVQRAFLNATRQRKEESDVRYQNGLMSFDDWIRVVVDYVNSQTGFLRSEQNLILAEAQWRFAIGEQLGDLQ